MKSNFKLSRSIINSIPNSSNNSTYDVIFTCGGSKRTTSTGSININSATALIIDQKSYNHDSDIPAYIWKLPETELPTFRIDVTNAIYSNTYGLIKIDADISRLPFDIQSQNSTSWAWKHVTDLNHVQVGPEDDDTVFVGCHDRSIALINDVKLVICAGYGYADAVKTVVLYDLRQDKFRKLPALNCERCRSGIYMDELNDKLYIGGGGRGMNGQFSLDNIEYMDMVKCDKWIELPETGNAHNCYPALWIEDGYILYIASCGKDIERLDLRENKEWESLCDDKGGMINTDALFGLNKVDEWSWRDIAAERLLIST